MAPEEEFVISVPDFPSAVKSHLNFLKVVDSNLKVHRELVLKNAIRRYEFYWLPLVVENPDLDLEPALDIHWVWHVHLLAPAFYIQDCKRVVSKVPGHRHFDPKSAESSTAQNLAKELWEKKYQDEPFSLHFDNIFNTDDPPIRESQIVYNILSAASRQKSFVYHVSLPHFNDDKFIDTAVKRYCKFIRLKKRHPTLFVVPMYDVDLVWHTHQLFHHCYVRDTKTYLGSMLPHDDSTTDRSDFYDIIF